MKWSGARLGNKVLDVCCGSGDIALLLAKLVGPRGQVRPEILPNPIMQYCNTMMKY